jgi:hypothetical protein
MQNLLGFLLRWLGRHLLNLLLIVVLLLGVRLVFEEWRQLEQQSQSLRAMRDASASLVRWRDDVAVDIARRVPAVTAPLGTVARQLDELRIAQARQQAERDALWRAHPIERLLPTTPTFRRLMEMDLQLAAGQQGLDFAQRLQDFLSGPVQAQARLAQLQQQWAKAEFDLAQSKYDQWRLSVAQPWAWQVPLTQAWTRMKALEAAETRLVPLRADLQARVAAQQALVQALGNRQTPPGFAIDRAPLDRLLAPLDEEIVRIQALLEGTALRRLLRPVLQVLPQALAILAAVVLSPLLVKGLAYYLVAPLATRRAPLRLLPEESGALAAMAASGDRISSPSLSLLLAPGEQLLLRPQFLHGTPLEAQKDTRWLLDWRMPLTSLAAGMVGLLRVRVEQEQRITVSSTTDPLAEFACIDVPAGAALVLQPRCLAGLLQPSPASMHISRHWRLAHLSAWLTFQLRYLVFHGPVRLIVQGPRGVRMEAVRSGRSVNQAATLGFSAGLAYAVARNETFPSYLFGQRALFQDRWTGDRGHCLYAETPATSARGGLFGRGLEGALDTLLKAFGV